LKVLLVEDDPDLGPPLAARLGRDGFIVDHVVTLGDAREAVRGARYRAVLLDRRLPDGDGLELLAFLRIHPPAPAVLLVTALDDVPERVAGLEAGADDYLIKPFAYEELRARLLTQLRRTPADGPLRPVEIGRLRYELSSREVWVGDQPLPVPRRELALLDALIRRAGRVVSREHLEAALYGYDDEVQPNALEAQVSRLRRRLLDADAGVEIHVARGIGYVLRAAT
jgi:two-component system OmpR family response regulator